MPSESNGRWPSVSVGPSTSRLGRAPHSAVRLSLKMSAHSLSNVTGPENKKEVDALNETAIEREPIVISMGEVQEVAQHSDRSSQLPTDVLTMSELSAECSQILTGGVTLRADAAEPQALMLHSGEEEAQIGSEVKHAATTASAAVTTAVSIEHAAKINAPEQSLTNDADSTSNGSIEPLPQPQNLLSCEESSSSRVQTQNAHLENKSSNVDTQTTTTRLEEQAAMLQRVARNKKTVYPGLKSESTLPGTEASQRAVYLATKSENERLLKEVALLKAEGASLTSRNESLEKKVQRFENRGDVAEEKLQTETAKRKGVDDELKEAKKALKKSEKDNIKLQEAISRLEADVTASDKSIVLRNIADAKSTICGVCKMIEVAKVCKTHLLSICGECLAGRKAESKPCTSKCSKNLIDFAEYQEGKNSELASKVEELCALQEVNKGQIASHAKEMQQKDHELDECRKKIVALTAEIQQQSKPPENITTSTHDATSMIQQLASRFDKMEQLIASNSQNTSNGQCVNYDTRSHHSCVTPASVRYVPSPQMSDGPFQQQMQVQSCNPQQFSQYPMMQQPGHQYGTPAQQAIGHYQPIGHYQGNAGSFPISQYQAQSGQPSGVNFQMGMTGHQFRQ